MNVATWNTTFKDKMFSLETFFTRCYVMSMEKERFRAWRKSLGWTQEEAGKELGLSRSTVIRYEQGQEMPHPRLVELATERLSTKEHNAP